jgi:uncharacterized protein (TIGR03437 family)
VADSLPLPKTLGGVSVAVKDVLGVERLAPLFFVSPTQINYELPAGTAIGEASVTIRQSGQGNDILAAGMLQIASVAPGLFTADASSRGVVVATVLRVKADGSQIYEPVAQFNSTTYRFDPLPIDLGAETDQLFLVAFGTGFRNRSTLSAVTATIGGATAEVSFAGAQGSLVGVDQANIRIPRSLAGRGIVELVLNVDGKTANYVTLSVR